MNKILLVAIVLFGVFTLAQQRKPHSRRYQYCPTGASLMSTCGENKVCAWNKCTCPDAGDHGCRLICTDHPYKLCYGKNDNEKCFLDHAYVCLPDSRAKLSCVYENGGGGGGGGGG